MSKIKKSKFQYRDLIVIVSILVVLMITFMYLAYDGITSIASGDGGTVSGPVYSIESMDYHLRSNATDYQVDLFNQLDDAINAETTDEQLISRLVVENFIADFYTFSNKQGNFDIGGMYYVYSPNRQSIYYEARDSFYKNLTNYISEYGQENLLEVESITTTSEEYRDEEIDGVKYTTYRVTAEWTYVDKNTNFDDSIYEKIGYFDVYINSDGRYEIVRTHGN